MATIRLIPDFKEFLSLLNSESVEYLVVGGFAVGLHGHPRGTNDIDIWIRLSDENAERVVRALVAFGFSKSNLSKELFLKPGKITRMGVPPVRIEILTAISGVEFDACYRRRMNVITDGIPVTVISLDDLKTNKKAAGRMKDLADLEELT